MLIAVDIGTTNVKAVSIGAEGAVLATADRENCTLHPAPACQEQNPEQVFQLVIDVLAEVWAVSKEIETLQGVIFSSAMHGLLAINASGNPLTNIILWSDTRADEIAVPLRHSEQGMLLYRQTGVPIHAMNPLCKLAWLRQNQPEIFKKTHWFADVKSYIWYRLTGERVSDISVASANGWLNLENYKRDETAIQLAGVAAEQLPEPVLPTHTAFLLPEIAARYHIPAIAPYIIGASDGALANLGSGATASGQVAVTIGTSAAIRTVSTRSILDERMRTFCYRLDAQRFIVGGASNNGTNALEWLRQSVFRSTLSAALFAEQANEAPAGSDGLLFLPYLLGERAPLYNAHVRGSFHGLTVKHTQAHFVRAVMEGVLFNLKMIGVSLESSSPIHTLHVGGGFSKNRLWVQMLADIFQKPVILPDQSVDASLAGALLFANEMLKNPIRLEDQKVIRIEPDPLNASIYEAAFERFSALAMSQD